MSDDKLTSINSSGENSAEMPNLTRRGLCYGAALLFSAGVFAASGLFGSKLAFAEPTSAEKQAEADAIAAKLIQWQDELAVASNNYFTAIDAHEAAIVAMGEAQGRIDAAQAIIADTQIKLGSRAANMYKDGPFSFLDVLFGATSFADFTTRWDLLNGINRENAELIAKSKEAREEAQNAHDEYATQELLAAAKLDEADQIRAGAEQTVAQYQSELAGLTAEVAELVQREQEAELARLAALNTAPVVNGGMPTTGGNNGNSDNNGNNGNNPDNSNDDNNNGDTSGSSEDGDNSDNVPEYQPPVDPPEGANTIVAAAYSQLGVPYVWAGSTPGVGFDCSGLTQWCYAQAGISIPRTDSGQYYAARSILAVADAAPGDILWKSGHVGISLGGGTYIHAPVPGRVVCIESWPLFTCALRF
jgi:cell wall-associated NlpC family hydrolase